MTEVLFVRLDEINAIVNASVATAVAALSPMVGSNNLSELTNKATARTTLGVAIGTDVQAFNANLSSWAAITRAAGLDTFVTTPNSANLRTLLTDETGTGAAVFANTPSLVTPIIGTAAPVAAGSIGYNSPSLNFGDGSANHVLVTLDQTQSLTSKTISATNSSILIPYFSAYLSANQSLTTNTATKLLINTEVGDSNNWYDNVTNFRFNPQLAGKYRFNGAFAISSTTITEVDIYIYKNGAIYARQFSASSSVSALSLDINIDVPMNGTTDYVELWALAIGTGGLNALGNAGSISTWFEGQYVGA